MCSDPKYVPLLIGMGLRRFSMSPAFIPSIKQLAKLVSRERAEAIVARALALKTTNTVKRFLSDELNKLAPDLALLDMV